MASQCATHQYCQYEQNRARETTSPATSFDPTRSRRISGSILFGRRGNQTKLDRWNKADQALSNASIKAPMSGLDAVDSRTNKRELSLRVSIEPCAHGPSCRSTKLRAHTSPQTAPVSCLRASPRMMTPSSPFTRRHSRAPMTMISAIVILLSFAFELPTFVRSQSPTSGPTAIPTVPPSLIGDLSANTPAPSLQPTTSPSTLSDAPSVHPSISGAPTIVLSVSPSISFSPTTKPTLREVSAAEGLYSQVLILSQSSALTEAQQFMFENNMQGYAPNYISSFELVDIECEIKNQVVTLGRRLQRTELKNLRRRGLQKNVTTIYVNTISYTMSYSSLYVYVASYPDDFESFINANLPNVTADLRYKGLTNITEVSTAVMSIGTEPPTTVPSSPPTFRPIPYPSTLFPTASPTVQSSDNLTVILAATSAIVGGMLVVLVICLWLRKKRRNKLPQTGTDATSVSATFRVQNSGVMNRSSQRSFRSNSPASSLEGSGHKGIEGGVPVESNGRVKFNQYMHRQGSDNMMNSNDSLVINRSLISPCNSMSSDSFNDFGDIDNTMDEFDKYKDQNLERMRAGVEGTVTNLDGMMSQALTKALMDDDGVNRDMSEPTWGGSGNSMEIEASVLCEMNDWLKKNEGASLDDRRELLQETLNKVVASVRRGILPPEDATRTIHGCAAMLGLQLEEDIPETALIVNGMRKMVGRRDMLDAFKTFGDVEDAAVSPNARGFGLVRFKSQKSVARAIERFRTGEIVVQDVAVMIKVLRPDVRNVVGPYPVEASFLSDNETSRPNPTDRRRFPPAGPPPVRQTSRESNRSTAMNNNYSPDLAPHVSANNNRPYIAHPAQALGSESGSVGSRKSDRSSKQTKRSAGNYGAKEGALLP